MTDMKLDWGKLTFLVSLVVVGALVFVGKLPSDILIALLVPNPLFARPPAPPPPPAVPAS